MHILSYPHPSVRVMNNLLAKPELDCIQHVEQLISPISLELDKFPNYDDILIELEQLRNLLENY